MTTRQWDAATYDRVSGPQLRWGLAVLERLAPAGDERVLDAGCGSGRVTERLLERRPRGTVVALDGLGPHPVVDYVRLDILATRGWPGGGGEPAGP